MCAIPETTTFEARANAWHDGEYLYCRALVGFKGNFDVGREPAVIASYLRLQGCRALRSGEYEISARLLASATWLIANNGPQWEQAYEVLIPGRQE